MERQVLAAIAATADHDDVAAISSDGRWLFAHRRADAGPLGSAVFQLVVGIYESLPRTAHATVRGRILTSNERTRFDHEIGKVTAGKLRAAIEMTRAMLRPPTLQDMGPPAADATGRAIREGALPLDAVAGLEERPAHVRRLLQALPVEHAGARHCRDRRVVAMAFGPDGTPLWAARNLNGRNRVLHAEINLLLGWWEHERRPLPLGCRVITSLKPCRMCAAALVDSTDGGRPTVVFVEDDPGRYALSTVLDELDLLQQAR
jgi:tRNA(Arg) A34 adenosine deaminase TadA